MQIRRAPLLRQTMKRSAVVAVTIVAVGCVFQLLRLLPRDSGLDSVRATVPAASTQVANSLESNASAPSRIPQSIEPSSQSALRSDELETTWGVVATVLGPDSEPVANAEARILERPEYPVATSDAAGRISVEYPFDRLDSLARKGTATIEIGGVGWESVARPVYAQPGGKHNLGTIRLRRGADLEGQIVDGNGVPLPGACVQVHGLGHGGYRWVPKPDEVLLEFPHSRPLRPEIVANHRGEFHLTGLPRRVVDLWAIANEHRAGVRAGVDLAGAAATQTIVLALEPLETWRLLDGRVVDTGNEPVVGVRVASRREDGDVERDGPGAVTDSRGQFALVLRHNARHRIHVVPSEARFAEALTPWIMPGTRNLVVRLDLAPQAPMTIVNATGAPVARGLVQVLERSQGRPLIAAHEFHDGQATVVVPGREYEVRVLAVGYAPLETGAIQASSNPPSRVLLQPGGGVRGRVLAKGLPVAGATVALHPANQPGTRRQSRTTGVPFGSFDIVSSAEPLRTDVTAADGTYELALAQSGWFSLRAVTGNDCSTSTQPMELSPAGPVAEIDLEFVPLGRIEGIVRSLPQSHDGGYVVGASNGDGFARCTSVGPTGSFALENLYPGNWQVRLCPPESPHHWLLPVDPREPDTKTLTWDCVVVPGGTSPVEIEPFSGLRFVSGTFVYAGIPGSGWKWRALPATSLARPLERSLSAGQVAYDDSFQIAFPAASVEGSEILIDFTGPRDERVFARVSVAQTNSNWYTDIRCGAVRIHGLESQRAPGRIVLFRSEVAAGVQSFVWVQPGTSETVELPFVPVGPGTLVARDFAPGLGILEGDWEVLAKTVVTEGKITDIDLLP